MGYHEIVADLADAVATRIARRAIKALQGMTYALLSGDDSGLRNTWDEICVQMQFEESHAWHVYIETIRGLIQYDVESLPKHEAQAIWLQTPRASEWECETDGEGDVPIFVNEIEDYILNDYILAKAADWSNPRIRAYLDNRY